MPLEFTLNDENVSVEVELGKTLLWVLREHFDLIGAKEGCGVGECGACTVLLEGRAINACLVLAGKVHGKSVVTIEGLGGAEALHPLQSKFIEGGAVQCGYCTPGMLLSAKALLDRQPNPTVEEIKVALSGNVCRCTGYTQIVDAVSAVGAEGVSK